MTDTGEIEDRWLVPATGVVFSCVALGLWALPPEPLATGASACAAIAIVYLAGYIFIKDAVLAWLALPVKLVWSVIWFIGTVVGLAR